jgi:hypothetical protein
MPSGNGTTPPICQPAADVAILVQYVESIRAQLQREREMFLAMVDERERLLGIEPRTAEIRRWWRERVG